MDEKCVNCKISGVPLELGLDGRLHCERCGGKLVYQDQESEEEETQNGKE